MFSFVATRCWVVSISDGQVLFVKDGMNNLRTGNSSLEIHSCGDIR